jgi:hypothetical protein
MPTAVNTAVNTAIGMMDPAYFVGRNEILNWLNNLLKLNLVKYVLAQIDVVALVSLSTSAHIFNPLTKIDYV